MRKLLIVLICILLIIVGVYSIKYLLNPRNFIDFDETTVEFKEYRLFNYGDHFKTYSIENKEEFDYSIDRVNIKYKNNVLSINDKVIDNVLSIYEYFAIYDDCFIVVGYIQDGNSYILNYNINLDEEMIINDYKDMIPDFKEGLIFEDDGIIVNYSFINDNKYIKDDSSICDINDQDMVVVRTVEHYYDMNEKFIDKTEELYTLSLIGYTNKYQLCK